MSVKLEHLFCFVQGTYILAWSKEGGRLPRNSNDTIGVLVINDVDVIVTDTGTYICTGSDFERTHTALAILRVNRNYLYIFDGHF